MQDFFLELIKDKTKSAEDIYNIMIEKYKDFYSTKKILRGLKSWDNSIYQGTIGENDFIISEASSTTLDSNNIKMIFDNYKNTMIKFIELFREEHEKNPDKHIITIINSIANPLLAEVFKDTSRNDELATKQRNSSSKFDQDDYMKKYNVSSQCGEGKSAVCCEKNVTIGNVFQFVGIETYHVTGTLTIPEREDIFSSERHAFTLIKYGEGIGKFALIDKYNNIVLQNILPGDYDFSNGFRIKYYAEKYNKTLIYQVNGPLYEMSEEILKTEAYIRKLAYQLNQIEKKCDNNFSEELKVDNIKQEFEDLILVIKSSAMNETLKDRYITRIQSFYLKK